MRKTASVPADWSHSCSEAIIAPPRSVRGGGTGRQAPSMNLRWAARPSARPSGLALEGCGLAVPLDARWV
eukprot:scaffold1969_cov130-Isochrysis_galbana.AAC.6